MKQWFLAASIDVARVISNNPIVSTLAAIFMSFFGLLYGTRDVTAYGMSLITLLIVIDWLAGFSAAKKDGIDTSSYGLEGLFRTMVLLLLPAAANYIDEFFFTQGFVSYFMIAALARHLMKSVIANVIRVGWTTWIPVIALERLSQWVSNELAHKESRAKERYNSIYKEEEK